jgi:transcription initiation factor IIE alpha subunit
MENKERYYRALIEDNGQLNEVDLGEKLGLDENETREIIVRLISEHKIEYMENRACNYSLMTNWKRKNKSRK